MTNKVAVSILLAGSFIAGSIILTAPQTTSNTSVKIPVPSIKDEGITIEMGDLAQKLVDAGVIDESKLPVRKEHTLVINRENSTYALNFLWALGLSNKNEILEYGEMMNPEYGGAGRFASTGGWTAARGNAMDHYSMHSFLTLTPEKQALVDKVSSGVYRPCCGNSAHFPDCNHGMAMLGLLELMAFNGATEDEMWHAALVANTYWFPDAYRTIQAYKGGQGIRWQDVEPKEVLGQNYSSSRGYANISAQITKPQKNSGSGSCSL